MDSLSLYELNNLVSSVIEQTFEDDVWVRGELLEGRPGGGGHFYGELVEKDELTGGLLAKARITIWARTYSLLRNRFENETGQTLKPGLKLLLKVRVCFHEQYGYSLNVVDIDPSFTLGDMVRRRQQIIAQLEKDGVIDDNRTLPLPTLLKRIAVVSSDKAAGYGDFCDQLLNNEYGLYFDVRLFPALMQGARVEETILSALDKIALQDDRWDAVVIIRGGGAVSDLSDFDSYNLASAIAQFPLPVFTGIGHERDETVLDRVAHTSLKTPTAVAAYILDYQVAHLARLEEIQNILVQSSLRKLEREHQRLDHLSTTLPLSFARVRDRQEHLLQQIEERMHTNVSMRLERENYRLQLLEQRVQSLDPALLLRRGYSITLCNGVLVTSASQLKEGDVITTQLANGKVSSKVLA